MDLKKVLLHLSPKSLLERTNKDSTHFQMKRMHWKLLKTKTIDFSISNKQFSSNYLKKSQNNDTILLKNPKSNYIILVISI
jgi:hypothetical protein